MELFDLEPNAQDNFRLHVTLHRRGAQGTSMKTKVILSKSAALLVTCTFLAQGHLLRLRDRSTDSGYYRTIYLDRGHAGQVGAAVDCHHDVDFPYRHH
jgi:hypothetical protein